MTVLTETVHPGEFLLSEANGFRSREAVTVTTSTTTMLSGTVMGKITASGKYIPYDNGASDGSQAAAGILLNELEGVSGDVAATIVVRDAEVLDAKLTGIDSAGRTDLAALGIILR
jgi:hypothetical protein